MKNLFIAALMLVFNFGVVSCDGNKKETDSKEVAKEENEKKFDETAMEVDTEFAVAAADGGMLEVQLGKLALQNAASPNIKQFAQMMVDEHSAANEELKVLAASKNITLPSSLGEKYQQEYNDLAAKKGSDFDKAYADFMVADHKKDTDHFEKEAIKGKDADIKNWASGKISVLQHHLKMAEAAMEMIKNNK